MSSSILNILIIALSILFGLLAGNAAVYLFNKIPLKWLCDYGEEPAEELKGGELRRIRSYPWKPALSMIFTVICIKLGIENWQFAIPAVIAIFILVEIIFADRLYMIIPDQFVALLMVTGFGFIPFYNSFRDPLLGTLMGLLPMLLIYLTGKIFFKKEVMGFGDVKLMSAVGFLLGPEGAGFTFITGFLCSGIFYGAALLMKKISINDEEPLGPFLGLAAILYLVFYKDLHLLLNII